MTQPVFAEDQVIAYPGHDTTRQAVLAAARDHLIGRGKHHLDVDDALVDGQGKVGRAWWGGEEVGFVQEGYPGAQAVTVVNLPKGMVPGGDVQAEPPKPDGIKNGRAR